MQDTNFYHCFRHFLGCNSTSRPAGVTINKCLLTFNNLKAEVAHYRSSAPLKRHGELRACWRRPKTCENVWWNPRRLRPSPTGRAVLRTGQRCGCGPVLYPVFRRRLRTAVSSVLVSGHEHASETHRLTARIPEQEEDRYTDGAGGRATQVLPEVVTQKTPFLLYETTCSSYVDSSVVAHDTTTINVYKHANRRL